MSASCTQIREAACAIRRLRQMVQNPALPVARAAGSLGVLTRRSIDEPAERVPSNLIEVSLTPRK